MPNRDALVRKRRYSRSAVQSGIEIVLGVDGETWAPYEPCILTGACHTANIIPPSRLWSNWLCDFGPLMVPRFGCLIGCGVVRLATARREVEMFEIGKPDLTPEAREGLPGSFAELATGVTHYELGGEPNAPCVVLIHGNAAPYVSWDNTIEDLVGAGLRVLRYDVIGHGFSDRPRLRTYDRALYVKQLAELVDHLEIPYPISVVGTSQGGSIGACFTAENPGKVERLAFLAPLFDDFVGSDSVMSKIMSTRFLGELVLQLAGDSKFSDLSGRISVPDKKATLEREVAKQLQFRGKRRVMLANWRGDSFTNPEAAYADVKAQGIPMLLLWGSQDELLLEDSMQRLRDLLPDLEYHEIDGASHLAHYEYPERVNPILIEFLTRPKAEEVPTRAAG